MVSGQSQAKLDALTLLASKASSNVIELDDSTYAGFATDERARPYKLLVLMTASHPKFKCSICKQVESDFDVVASSYVAHLSKEGLAPSIFFLKIDYANAPKTFRKYDVSSVPVTMYLSPSHGLDSDPYEVNGRDKLMAGAEIDDLANFLSTKSGESFHIYKPMLMAYLTLGVFLAFLLYLIRSVIKNLEWWVALIQIKSIWMTVSLGIYVCAISGLIFDIIRSPPMYQQDPRTKQLMFFYPHQGNQFVVEGFVIGFLNLACGGALCFLGLVAPTISKDTNKQSMVMAVSAAVFVACFYAVRGFYRLKNGWYNF